jgi:acyl carrier protein
MSGEGSRDAGWQSFAASVAQVAGLPAERVEPGTKVIEDLGLDSLALTELVVLLIDEYDMASLYKSLETRSWADTTVAQLFDEAVRSQPSAGGAL